MIGWAKQVLELVVSQSSRLPQESVFKDRNGTQVGGPFICVLEPLLPSSGGLRGDLPYLKGKGGVGVPNFMYLVFPIKRENGLAQN